MPLLYKKAGESKWNNPDRDLVVVLPIAIRTALVNLGDLECPTRIECDENGICLAELRVVGRHLGKFFYLHSKECPEKFETEEEILEASGLEECDDLAVAFVYKEAMRFMLNQFSTWSLVGDGILSESQVSDIMAEYTYRGTRVVGFGSVIRAFTSWARSFIRRLFCLTRDAEMSQTKPDDTEG